MYESVRLLEKTPNKATSIIVTFKDGIPVAVDNKKLSPVTLLEKLNKIGGTNGVGVVDIVENRFVGMKSRRCLRNTRWYNSKYSSSSYRVTNYG